MRRRVVRNLVALGSGTGMAALLSLLTAAANSRALSITEFGTYILLQSLALLIAGLISFATQQPVIKLGVAALEAGQVQRFEWLVGLGLALDVLAALLTGAIAITIVLVVPGLVGLSTELTEPAIIVAFCLFFQGFKTAEAVFRVFDRFALMGAIQVAVAVLQLAMALVLWGLDAPFWWYGLLIAGVVALPPMVQLSVSLYLLRSRGMRPRLARSTAGPAGADPGPDTSGDRREFIAYCWTTSIMSSCDTIRSNGDTALVGAIVSVEAAGIYGVAKQLAGIVRKATIIYASVLFPEFASMAASRAYDRAKATLRRVSLIAAGLTAVLVAGAAMLGGLALRLIFGPEFSAGHLTLILLVAAAGLQIVSATYSMCVQTFTKPVYLLYAYFVATIVFVLSAIPCLYFFGVGGAAIAQIAFVMGLLFSCKFILNRRRAFEGGINEN